MSKRLNNRRRFLAFMGLFGAPTAVWAQTTSDPTIAAAPSTEVVCSEQLLRAPGIGVAYYRHFYLSGGTLAPADNGDYSTVVTVPAKTQYGERFSDGAAVNGDPMAIPADATQLKIASPTTNAIKASFSTHIRVPGPLAKCSVVLVTSAGQLAPTTGGYPKSSTDPGVLTVYANWDGTPAQVMTGPVQVGIYFEDQLCAIFDFDLTASKAYVLIDKKDKDLQARTGLTLDLTASKVSGLETCAVYDASTAGTMPCFFTTAAVETLGLSDDCWEMQTLRAFRDGPLSLTAEGRALTIRYYNEAPRLVEGISRREDAHKVWLAAYWTHILPCAVLAKVGLHRLAVAHYTRLFNRLEQLAV